MIQLIISIMMPRHQVNDSPGSSAPHVMDIDHEFNNNFHIDLALPKFNELDIG